MSKALLYRKLKQILLEEEKEVQRSVQEQLRLTDEKIEDREKLEARVQPILEDNVIHLKRNFSALFGDEVTQSIRDQIKNSQEEVIEALYPIIGKMIKKYIVKELELLSERIDRQLESAFSWKNFANRLKAWFAGAKPSTTITRDLLEPSLEQILVVQKDSGILVGSYTRSQNVDTDMIAGMLTAIKAFAEDAFDKGQDLENIEYETFKLVIRSFRSFYVVAAVSGGWNASFKNRLDDLILDFTSKILTKNLVDNEENSKLNESVQLYFDQVLNDSK
ncbi:cell envelope biogenesis protein OmpA [Fulvivirga sp. M361]|uniref:cell envelope biogenesis protein OmpA n=1 Tax=Fulvivirga sp. M361 TaxID=2594266 RepID=UPI001179F581|nr:cell envelope biogenesis protein OmpA [Fulvivirga sp. M361]TRX52383.1 cell envelope biogenesis protein OmpA [Fulvivirga sp. M361]